ncbi:MAG TPA: FAD-dependent oxidoreductase [Haliangiales bacterium]|nr:FAD-dependent oxidoreductase [Haliangiales bacterium]
MKTVVVVGAGLAGLTAALELVDKGFQVTVIDAAGRAGGKAGSDRDAAGIMRDHGMHIFPGWYANLRGVLARIGVAECLIDHDHVAYLSRGKYPDIRILKESSSWRNNVHNLLRGPLPWYRNALYFYFLLDLAGQHFDKRRFLDQVSETGLLYARWYRDEEVARFCQANILHAASVNADEVSAMSWQRVVRNWLSAPSPFFSIVRGSLQDAIIDPFVRVLRDKGVAFELGRTVTKLDVAGGRVAGVRWGSSAGPGVSVADRYVVAAPLEVVGRLVDDDVYAAAPDLGEVHRLQAEPMSGFYIDLADKIPGLGSSFCFLVGSQYGLSIIDTTPEAATSALSVVVSDFGPMRSLSPGLIERLVLAELREYLPIPAASVVRTALHDNADTPLYINTAGSWADRPGTRTQIPNLYLAGDYCRNPTDLATMEGAVVSARIAARELGHDEGVALAGPDVPREMSPFLLRLLVRLSAPIMVIPWLRARFG